jgi:type II secretory pathway pseudopilin PulG
MIEVLVAVFILLVGIVATLGVFGSSKRTTLVAQRHEVAVHQAQREMEKLRAMKYSELGLEATSAPAHNADPNNPDNRIVNDGNSKFRTFPALPLSDPACCEEQVTQSTGATGGKVEHTDTFAVSQGSTGVTGTIYRYITWRDEQCAVLVCDGTRNTKRLIVGVTLNAAGSPKLGPLKPVWETSIASDPNEGPTSSANPPPPPPPPPATSAQNFYLYDKRCRETDFGPSPNNNDYEQPTASHGSHNTASDSSVCLNAGGATDRRPSLMGPAAPTYAADPPLPPYKYSDEILDDFPAGLALKKQASGCPKVSYPAADADVAGGKQSAHAWATRAFSQPFQLSGRVFLSVWTTSIGSVAGTGRFCATLVDRKIVGGVPNDIVLGSMSREYYPWPSTKNEPGRSCGTADFPCGRQLAFTTTITSTTVRQGGRLVLVLAALSTSDKDLVFLYDDPRYRTLLEVETSTPCTTAGNPCSNS